MLDKYDLERIKDQKFWSIKHNCFVEIKGITFKIADKKIDLKDVSVMDKETQDIVADLIYESKTKQRLEKETDHQGRVLLGRNDQGQNLWLVPPSWDCSWYWGFGYIQTKHSHQHFSGFVGQQEKYFEGHWCKGDYIHNIYDSPQIVETTFSYDEGWKLSELFRQFYLLRDMAEYSHRSPAGCHLTTSPVVQDAEKMKEWHEYINKVMIPLVTAEIMRMLTP